MQQSNAYYIMDRQEWKKLNKTQMISMTNEELESVRALNDKVSLKDVKEVYLPILSVLNIRYENYLKRQRAMRKLLNQSPQHETYVIGIAGSVAVGKSTLARVLQIILNEYYKALKIDLITTDGFLFPNEILKERHIMHRKGFPESYDMDRLINFMGQVKAGTPNIRVPKYSHEFYNIIPDEYQIVNQPDILIVEGINTLQLPSNEKIYASDFFDFNLYVDAKPEYIEKWYLDRFRLLVNTSFKNPDNYYTRFADVPLTEAIAYAQGIWQDVNEVNLVEYILPTRFRADLILHKTVDHYIDKILLRKH
ncbi:type I pantothenate kinase [Allofustis seminis]|uniref:type I pantothenate kinase n=1 Tax=Allofustis seminis TaxID=166939 RepID=UPI000367D1B5|nr:type I pantothenate kinase [Allofustis seminis]